MFSVLLSSELSGNWTSVLSRRLERSGGTLKLMLLISKSAGFLGLASEDDIEVAKGRDDNSKIYWY
jgi:hypothetical protein